MYAAEHVRMLRLYVRTKTRDTDQNESYPTEEPAVLTPENSRSELGENKSLFIPPVVILQEE